MDGTRDQLLRLLEGSLPADEEQALRARIASDPVLGEQLDRVRSVRATVREGAAASFALGFGDRVMARMGASGNGDDALYGALSWLFRRAAIASLLAAAALGALNVAEYRGLEVSTSVFESIFGLPTVTLDEAITVEPV